MKKQPFAVGEYYHIFNRGVDKRQIVMDEDDSERFMESVRVFNNVEPVGSLYLVRLYQKPPKNNKLRRPTTQKVEKAVDVIAYCLNPNHFHFLLRERVDGGISEFIRRLSGGYARYFNDRYDRTGALFQGKFKAVHVETNEQLLYVSAYVNLNNLVHSKFSGRTSQLVRSSWDEYCGKTSDEICEKDIIIKQFHSQGDYRQFTKDVVMGISKIRGNTKNPNVVLGEHIKV